jgi:predicted CxxxxCH...CXXCH cytochrome family protein
MASRRPRRTPPARTAARATPRSSPAPPTSSIRTATSTATSTPRLTTKDLAGNTDPTAPGVGAHRAHVGPSEWRRELYCSQCHVVPVNIGDPGHVDGDNVAEITFDGLNPQGTFDRATSTCSNLYCHGNGWNQLGTKTWTQPGALNCTSCHNTNGEEMSGKHKKHFEKGYDCVDCHRDVINAQRAIITPDLHLNGVHDVKMAQGTYDPATRFCTNIACHNNKKW